MMFEVSILLDRIFFRTGDTAAQHAIGFSRDLRFQHRSTDLNPLPAPVKDAITPTQCVEQRRRQVRNRPSLLARTNTTRAGIPHRGLHRRSSTSVCDADLLSTKRTVADAVQRDDVITIAVLEAARAEADAGRVVGELAADLGAARDGVVMMVVGGGRRGRGVGVVRAGAVGERDDGNGSGSGSGSGEDSAGEGDDGDEEHLGEVHLDRLELLDGLM